MKVLFIHNSYSEKTPTGEEHASKELAALLAEHGHEVRWFKRSSDEIRTGLGPMKSFFTGIYNPSSAREIAKMLDEFKPDIVQVQNLYPLLSSSIFDPIKKRGIPVVMRCPNYRLFCPIGLSLDKDGNVCEKCWGGFYEWNCIKGNCKHSLAMSIGYALRNAFNRVTRKILNGVDTFIVQSEFQKQKFIKQGIPADKLLIVPGISPNVKRPVGDNLGEWVSFVGRVSTEKGIYEFIEAARQNPNIPFKVAGSYDSNFVMPSHCPSNIEFMGFLKGPVLDDFYFKSRIIVVPSKWYEGFPNVILRAFLFDRPVITTNIGAMQSIVTTGKNGLLVEAGDAEELSKAIRKLYFDEDLCKIYGKAGHIDAETLYSREQVYILLMNAYENAKFNKTRLNDDN